MEVFNKIYTQVSSSVSSTVSQLSGVLPGNPVTREFDANEHIASGGPGLLWKIYRGVKKSTKQEASIFVLEKRQLEKYSKSDREVILEVLRRGVTQLTKIRHPQILTVQNPLEESRESLAFATEPVFASLANVLGDTYNMPQSHHLSDYKFYDIEIKFGLLQIGEGLAFLHNDVKLIHKNIGPESIIINHQGAWKIFGFDFCVHNTSPANANPSFPLEEYIPSLPDVGQPTLDYMAPECIISLSQSCASDMFSLGMLCFVLFSPGHQTISRVRDIQQFKARANQLKNLPTSKLTPLPEHLRKYVKKLLSVTPESRPDAHLFVRIPFFDDVGVKTLNHLDSLLQWDNLQKSQFYKGLAESMAKLPQRVRLQRVLPCLVRDLTQPSMVPFVLPNILDIAQNCKQEEYIKYVLPFLKPVMKLTEPVQILLIFLQRMELLLKQTPADEVQQHVLPMLYRGLDSDSPQIHELCLSVLPTFAGLLDHANVKNHLLPRIKKLCLASNNLSVRVNCLLCIGRLLEHLDKWLVLDDVLPFLPKIPSREPAVLMGILGIYKMTMNHKKLGISKEILATRVLPFLMPLCIENGLNLTQFNALVALVKQMFQSVETEHRTKLEQLNSVQQERKVLEATMPPIKSPSNDSNGLDSSFSGLGLDNFVTNSSKSSATKTQQDILSSLSPLEPKSTDNLGSGQKIAKPRDLTLELARNATNIPALTTSQSMPLNAMTASQPNYAGSARMQSPVMGSFQPPTTGNAAILAQRNNGTSWNMNKQQQQQQSFPNNWPSPPLQQQFAAQSNKWNTFGSLLDGNNLSDVNKTQVNQIMTPNRNITSSAGSSSNNSNIALSKDEILDFLS